VSIAKVAHTTERNVWAKMPAHSLFCIGTSFSATKIASYETPALPAKCARLNNLLTEMTCKQPQCLSFLASNAAISKQ
jgi:cytochrome c-type biogenesis protein CcmH/NrfF